MPDRTPTEVHETCIVDNNTIGILSMQACTWPDAKYTTSFPGSGIHGLE